MRSVPNTDFSGMPSPREVLKRFSAKLRRERIERKARKLNRETQSPGPRVHPLLQRPVIWASIGTARIEPDSSEGSSPPATAGRSAPVRRDSVHSAYSSSPRSHPRPFPAPLIKIRSKDDASPSQNAGSSDLPPILPALTPIGPLDRRQDTAGESADTATEHPVASTPQSAPAGERQSGAAKYAETHVPVANKPAPPGPPSLLGQNAPRDRRRSSGWKSADTKVGDADAITPALPVEKRKLNSSFSAGSTLLGSETKPDKYPCHICGYVLGKPRGHGNKIERLAFLPCGQAFGHECLFHWLTDSGVAKYRLDCCIPLRHACEHLTVPTKFPPAVPFTDVKAAVMPWNYEFCVSRKGLKVHSTIARATERLHRAEARKANREKSSMEFVHEAVRKLHALAVVQAEKELDRQHKKWWAVKWASFGVSE